MLEEKKTKREVGREICDMPVTGGMNERRGRTDGGGEGRKGTCDRERGIEEEGGGGEERCMSTGEQ